MVSTRTTRSCETLLRNSTMRGRREDCTAPHGLGPDGMTAILRPLVNLENMRGHARGTADSAEMQMNQHENVIQRPE